ncbi:MAG: hypothetical protein V2I33_00725 [Kangiellaceae bacterium]|jgi:REP element-mobilizing transposase RayT|nr:hypothetical protein [Kangiellaceae bacterium]
MMATARKDIISEGVAGFYHCYNRCVRRAYLCGIDDETGKDYSHRKQWLVNQIKVMSKCFAIDVYAYAIMDNHYHIVLYVNPDEANSWTDLDVVERWLNVYPSKINQPENATKRKARIQALLDDKEQLQELRKRLASVSWFMARLNEPLAKLSNQEDCVNGRFWQGRFESQALLDEAAVISCMAYVDLNPVRAAITQKLEASKYTSIKQRIDESPSAESLSNSIGNVFDRQKPSNQHAPISAITLAEYIQLTEWAGQAIVHTNKAPIPTHISPILERLNVQRNHWLNQVRRLGESYTTAIGSIDRLRERAERIRKRCLRGISQSKLLYRT